MGKHIRESIGVLSYNVPHRKTYDLLALLKAKGYSQVTVFAKPFHYIKKVKPLLEHRPEVNDYIDTPDILCGNLGYAYRYIPEGYSQIDLPENSIILSAGAGIIAPEVTEKYRIINSHPGYIPETRGLDAYKWAIYENKRIGVSTHYIGDVIDAGRVIDRREIKIRPNDTFHSVALRVYETEVEMLVLAIDRLGRSELGEIRPGADSVVRRRMPQELERGLLELFEERKRSALAEAGEEGCALQ